jgi:hypothetical protein
MPAPVSWTGSAQVRAGAPFVSVHVGTGRLSLLPESAATHPAVVNPGVNSGFIIADESAYAEHSAGGFAYSSGETVSALMRIFDTLRGECYRVSESAALLERTADAWTGGSPVFQVRTAEPA